MILQRSFIALILLAFCGLSLALPAELDAPIPDHIECGAGTGTDSPEGLPNIAAPDIEDLGKGADRLAKKGGTCTTPQGDGKCVRIACDNTTGIYFCNADGKEGPFSVPCQTVAAYVKRGDSSQEWKDILDTCKRDSQFFSVKAVAGMAVDSSGDWTIITGYANCNHPVEGASENPSSL
ncbi:uncharacterized protein KY384_008710 [Bacidia gigantensis]|uniref:uncharacterized protein n=1 Tax=Bacidia gigantensis TaxID=2732470 RepID=UPI001D04967B|nr:uncharacterized protein KY384_008710 [Bacidia gigantensis]KAG8526510.1 hypothetical protein KY384_008710 [Bacidia gigantensis]